VRCVTALSEAFASFFGAGAGVAALGAGVAALGLGAAAFALGAVLGLAGRGVSAGASIRGFLLGGSAKSSYISSFNTTPLSNNSPPSQLKVVSGERLVKRIGQKGRVVETMPKAKRFSPTETYKRLAAAPESRKEQPCSSKPQFLAEAFHRGNRIMIFKTGFCIF